jgi:C-terminal processing protease CtpA/Prc
MHARYRSIPSCSVAARLAVVLCSVLVAACGAHTATPAAHAPPPPPGRPPAGAPDTAAAPVDESVDTTAPPLGLEDLALDLAELDRLVREHWSYVDDKSEHFGLDLHTSLATAQAALEGEPDRQRFFDVLQRYVATLQDGHAGVRMPGVERPARAWPFTVVPAAEGLLVEVVAPATFAAMDVEPGDRLIAVDAVAAHTLLSDAMRRTPASTLGSRRAWGAASMRLTDRERSRFLMQKPSGRTYELEFENLPRDVTIPAPARYARGTSFTRLDDRTGYLRVGTFAAPDPEAWQAAAPEQRDDVLAPFYAQIRRAFAEMAGLQALVLDLRRNTGGTDLAGMEVARHLLPPGSVYFQLQGRLDDGAWGTLHASRIPDEPPEHPFGGRLVVLVDERTFSTSDNLAACLDDLHPDVTFVGRPTAGGTGAPRPFELPRAGAGVAVCTMRVERPAGGLIEGRGTTPDVLVTWTGADLAAGVDLDLAAARAFLAGTPPSDG